MSNAHKKHCSSTTTSNGVSEAMDCNGTAVHNTMPKDVGIIAMELYFPSQFVDQTELETFDGVSQGKYTIGLGQTRMGFCSDCEDIHSLCLTALAKLVSNTNIGYQSIGRLEVGTETIIDKSKSVKSTLMSELSKAGNHDVEGVDNTNACYGGTAALFNAINWVESSAWDGRYAVVIAADIAVYATGAARPTGGAGAVAMLVGPNAPLVLDSGVRSSYMVHAYDFYKPVLNSEYPVVDGKLSIASYFSALDACYKTYLAKASKRRLGVEDLSSFHSVLFHSPYCKLVQKSLARLMLNDVINTTPQLAQQKYPGLDKFREKKLEDTYFDKEVEKAFVAASSSCFASKTKPSLLLATEVGNMYTPSLYGGLVTLLARHSSNPQDLIGERLCLFSYGSGITSSMFSIIVKEGLPPKPVNVTNGDLYSNKTNPKYIGNASHNKTETPSGLTLLVQSLADLEDRLADRRKAAPDVFAQVMKLREETHHLAPYTPTGDVSLLFPGTFYLNSIDEMHRRTYSRVPETNVNKMSNICSSSLTNAYTTDEQISSATGGVKELSNGLGAL